MFFTLQEIDEIWPVIAYIKVLITSFIFYVNKLLGKIVFKIHSHEIFVQKLNRTKNFVQISKEFTRVFLWNFEFSDCQQ